MTAGRARAGEPGGRPEGRRRGPGEPRGLGGGRQRLPHLPGGSAPTHKVPRAEPLHELPGVGGFGDPPGRPPDACCERGNRLKQTAARQRDRLPDAAGTSCTPHREPGAGYGLPGVDYT